MIPLRDNVPTDRVAWATYALILVNIVVYLFFEKAAAHGILHVDQETVIRYGAIPLELAHPSRQCLQALDAAGNLVCGAHLPGARDTAAFWLTPFTAMFMHGGILHIAGNMLFLWVFGNNIEEAMGRVRFVAFYLLGGVAAIALQTAVDPGSAVPTIGASGAIAAVLGGYIVLYPRARVLTMVFLLFIFFVELPAVLVLGLWFLEQVAFGAGSLTNPVGDGGGVAYFAHVGGFAFGLLVVRALERRRNPNYLGSRPALA